MAFFNLMLVFDLVGGFILVMTFIFGMGYLCGYYDSDKGIGPCNDEEVVRFDLNEA